MPDFDDHMRGGWNGHMMGGGSAWTPWLVVLLVATVLLLVLAAVLATRFLRPGSAAVLGRASSPRPGEPPEEMLDRLFAAGEIDEATYRSRRTALAEMRQPARP